MATVGEHGTAGFAVSERQPVVGEGVLTPACTIIRTAPREHTIGIDVTWHAPYAHLADMDGADDDARIVELRKLAEAGGE